MLIIKIWPCVKLLVPVVLVDHEEVSECQIKHFVQVFYEQVSLDFFWQILVKFLFLISKKCNIVVVFPFEIEEMLNLVVEFLVNIFTAVKSLEHAKEIG